MHRDKSLTAKKKTENRIKMLALTEIHLTAFFQIQKV